MKEDNQVQIYDNLVEELLEKTCYVIDFLPEQVKPEAGGRRSIL